MALNTNHRQKLFGIAIISYTTKTTSFIRGQSCTLVYTRALFFPVLFFVVTPLALIPLIDQFF